MITIKNDGTVEPLNLKWIRDSKFQLIAPTRELTDEFDEFDGEIDFGTEYGTGTIELRCITEEGLSKAEKNTQKETLSKQLYDLRDGDYLQFESDPDKMLFVRVEGRPEIIEYPSWFQVNIPLRFDPIWVGTEENEHVGNGTLENKGTADASLIIEVNGIVTDPEIEIDGEVLKYNGTLAASDLLTIDTGNGTVTFNGFNALQNYEGVFPLLSPGETSVTAPANGTTTFKWRDSWV